MRESEFMLLGGHGRGGPRCSLPAGPQVFATGLALRTARKEIGSYLGAQLETRSRVLSQFRRRGWITVSDKDIELTDKTALAAL